VIHRTGAVCLLVAMVLQGVSAKHLKVGDRLPEYTFINLINYPKPTAKTTDFRGKLLLLDFWSTGCTSCVASWPKLETLQRQFTGRVQILLVNPWQNESVVRPLIEKRRQAGIVDLTLPAVCEDRALLELFAITTVPHLVWVDGTGVIQAITEGSELTSANIQAMVKGSVTVRQKEAYDREVSAMIEVPDDRVLWQSTFSSYRRGLRNSNDAFANPDMGYFMRMLNWPPGDFYRFAYSSSINRYGYLRFVPGSKVQVISRDSVWLRGGIRPYTDTASFYSYELVSGRPTTLPVLQARMRYDLQGQFPWRAKWESRVKRCLVLNVTDTTRLRYTGGQYTLNITDADFQVNKVTVTDMVQYLEDITNYGGGPYPIVDETGYRGRIGGISLTVNVYDIEALRRALLPHGLSLQIADRVVDILVISDPAESTDR
jgi:thiol-disulfide isomerase/thioredoxin